MKVLLFAVAFLATSNLVAQSTSESRYYTDSIYSESLQEYRPHNIYLPKNFDPKNKYKVIYATDGFPIADESKWVADFKHNLDSLIDNHLIEPVVYVASYCNSNKTSSYMLSGTGEKHYNAFRYFDYVINSPVSANGDSSLINRYNRHAWYFEKEFIPAIEKQLGLEISKENRIFYGYSNGAGFGVSFMNSHPDVIGQFICLSPVGAGEGELKWDKKNYPKTYLGYGTEEHEFIAEEAKTIAKEMKKAKADCALLTFKGIHGAHIGAPEFFRILKVAVPAPKG